MNGDNMNSAKSEASRHFRNKKREYQKDKMNEAADSKNKNMRDLYRVLFCNWCVTPRYQVCCEFL
jgi:hypothetical protein